VPLTTLLTAPATAGSAGTSPGKRLALTRVTVSGRYDTAHEIQARGRTVGGDVGFEIVTPLVLADGAAVLIDRGWVPAPPGGAVAAPTVPPAPTGPITVIGQLHLSESRPTPIGHRDGRLDTRRISLPRLAHEMPFPVYGAYVLLAEQTPAADPAFTRVPIDHEDAWQNAGYTVQWWLFAGMTLVAYGWYARREALVLAGKLPRTNPRARPTGGPPRKSGDRVEEADRRRAAATDRVAEADRKRAASGDRVEEADRAASGGRLE
jgi:cytochrome oxidase assembly protein ShyY1